MAWGLAALLCLYWQRRGLLIWSLVLLLGYWPLLVVFGGTDPFALETNLVRRVDLALLGPGHLWQGAGLAFDPEGLLSTLPAVVTVLLGYLTGQALGTAEKPGDLARPMACVGLGAVLIGWCWSWWLPINKALWTSSYVLFSAGWAWLVLAACRRNQPGQKTAWSG